VRSEAKKSQSLSSTKPACACEGDFFEKEGLRKKDPNSQSPGPRRASADSGLKITVGGIKNSRVLRARQHAGGPSEKRRKRKEKVALSPRSDEGRKQTRGFSQSSKKKSEVRRVAWGGERAHQRSFCQTG